MSPIATVEKSEKVKVQPQDWSNHIKTYLLVIPSRKTPGSAEKKLLVDLASSLSRELSCTFENASLPCKASIINDQ